VNILVVGGAGFIGSHMVKHLLAAGHRVVTLDNLSSGHRDAVLGGEFVPGDVSDAELLSRLFSSVRFNGVMHFASCIEVGESWQDPGKYYRNNVAHVLPLLETMVRFDVRGLVFSSSAAIFASAAEPLTEEHAKVPANPYGRTKWMVEQVLADFDAAHGLKSACLRYFNAAGADPEGLLGERHVPETHLIPRVLAAAARHAPIAIFGTDYDTPDGTCVRDYVHVADLCDAHLHALDVLMDEGASAAYNLGSGHGYSVREVIDAVQTVTGRRLRVEAQPRRAGDPPYLVADPRLAQTRLGWQPRYDLHAAIAHAWRWQTRTAPASVQVG
jgi:UDP-glucose 4-epimerase